jgi:hypothetical protein
VLPVADDWLQRVGRGFVTADISKIEDFRLQCLLSIRKNVESIGNGSGWYNGERQELEVDSVRTHLTEATHTMEILFYMIYFDDEFPTSGMILRWFELLRDCGFFDQFVMVSSLHQLLCCCQAAHIMIEIDMLKFQDF